MASPNRPNLDNYLFGVDCADATHCVAVGRSFDVPPRRPATWSSRWTAGRRGRSPRRPTAPTRSNLLADVSCADATHCMAVGYSVERHRQRLPRPWCSRAIRRGVVDRSEASTGPQRATCCATSRARAIDHLRRGRRVGPGERALRRGDPDRDATRPAPGRSRRARPGRLRQPPLGGELQQHRELRRGRPVPERRPGAPAHRDAVGGHVEAHEPEPLPRRDLQLPLRPVVPDAPLVRRGGDYLDHRAARSAPRCSPTPGRANDHPGQGARTGSGAVEGKRTYSSIRTFPSVGLEIVRSRWPRRARSATRRIEHERKLEVVGVVAPRRPLRLVGEAVRLPRHREAQLVPHVGPHVDPGRVAQHDAAVARRRQPGTELERREDRRRAGRPARRRGTRSRCRAPRRCCRALRAGAAATVRARRASTRARRPPRRRTRRCRSRSAAASGRRGPSGASPRAATGAPACGSSRGTRGRRCAPRAPGRAGTGWRRRSRARSPGGRGRDGPPRSARRGRAAPRPRRAGGPVAVRVLLAEVARPRADATAAVSSAPTRVLEEVAHRVVARAACPARSASSICSCSA